MEVTLIDDKSKIIKDGKSTGDGDKSRTTVDGGNSRSTEDDDKSRSPTKLRSTEDGDKSRSTMLQIWRF